MKPFSLPHLRAWRLSARLTQEDVAQLAGVWPSTVARLEHGRMVARPGTVARIADAIGITSVQLVNKCPPKPGAVGFIGARSLRMVEDSVGVWLFVPSLSYHRQDRAMSKAELSRRSGVPTHILADHEAQGDAGMMLLAEVQALAAALGVGVLELCGCYVPRSQRLAPREIPPVHPRLAAARRRTLARLEAHVRGHAGQPEVFAAA